VVKRQSSIASGVNETQTGNAIAGTLRTRRFPTSEKLATAGFFFCSPMRDRRTKKSRAATNAATLRYSCQEALMAVERMRKTALHDVIGRSDVLESNRIAAHDTYEAPRLVSENGRRCRLGVAV
jgi:hypothetical protein